MRNHWGMPVSMISPFILLKREGNRKHHHHHDNMVMLPLLWTSVGMYAMHHYQTPNPTQFSPLASSLAFSGFSSCSSAFELSCCSLLILISNLMCVVIPLLHTRALCSWTIIKAFHWPSIKLFILYEHALDFMSIAYNLPKAMLINFNWR